ERAGAEAAAGAGGGVEVSSSAYAESRARTRSGRENARFAHQTALNRIEADAMRSLPLRRAGDRSHLMLEDVLRILAVEVRLLERAADLQEHQLRRLVDASSKVDGYPSKVRHLEGDPSFEPGIDLRRSHVNGHSDTRPTASSLDQSDQV